jgi:formate hydrogenlyase subunit 3/multisubunit Na+/H+ antiporter MnhD subunit
VVIKTGAYALLRVLFLVFPSVQITWQLLLAVAAIVTMTVGNLMALLQEDLKRLLAYSSVAQMGYVIFGLTSIYGVAASLFHVMNHAIMKGLLFLCSGCYVHMAGTRDISELSGIWRKMPVTTAAFTVGAFAIAGMPPLNGFLSEFMLIMAGIKAGTSPAQSYMSVFAAIMILNVLFSVAYYLRLVQTFVLKKEGPTIAKAHEAPPSMLLPICILALLCILIGIYPYPFVSFAERAANAVLQAQFYLTAIAG